MSEDNPIAPLAQAFWRDNLAKQRYELAIHEAGHAVIGHLVGVEIDYVTIIPSRGASGYSMPVRHPVAATADKLWAEANAISRKLVLADIKDGKPSYVLRKGCRRFKNGNVRGTRAPQELVDRMDGLRRRASAMWKKANASTDHVKDLMHSLGGPVADVVFFNEPFHGPRERLVPKAELKLWGLSEAAYGAARTVGNIGASSDFRSIRRALKHIDNANWKEARELYRRRAEKLVRQHRATIERVAKALLKRKTLTGADLAKLICVRTAQDGGGDAVQNRNPKENPNV